MEGRATGKCTGYADDVHTTRQTIYSDLRRRARQTRDEDGGCCSSFRLALIRGAGISFLCLRCLLALVVVPDLAVSVWAGVLWASIAAAVRNDAKISFFIVSPYGRRSVVTLTILWSLGIGF